MSFTREVSKAERSKSFTASAILANIPDMLSTLDVSNPERSKEVSESHEWNIQLMSVTREVSNPVKSKASNDAQSLNMLHMFVTADVSKPETSRA